MTKPPPDERPGTARNRNGRPGTIRLTLDLCHRLSVALTADLRYSGDEVVRLLRDDELLVDTQHGTVCRRRTGEVIGTFEVLEQASEVEYVEVDGECPRPGAED
jgi:hypothetical protein